MPTIGSDCHITLAHAAIDSGTPYGFLVLEDGGIRAGGIQIVREVSTDGGMRVWVYADILLADHAVNPDGSVHAATRAEDYAKLLLFLDRREGLEMTSPAGALTNLGALGFTADERHLPDHAVVKCQFNNAGSYFPPVDPEQLAQSIWDGPLTWETSFWR